MSTSSLTSTGDSPGWPVLGKLVESLKDVKGFMRFCGILALGTLIIIGMLGAVGIGSDWPTGLVIVVIGLTAAFLVFGLASLGCVRLALSLEYGTPVTLETAQQKEELDLFAVRLFSLEVLTDDRIREYLQRRRSWEGQYATVLNRKFEDTLANLRAVLNVDLNALPVPAESRTKVVSDLETSLGQLQQDFLSALAILLHLREVEAGGFLARACNKKADQIQQYLLRLRDIVSRLPIRSGV